MPQKMVVAKDLEVRQLDISIHTGTDNCVMSPTSVSGLFMVRLSLGRTDSKAAVPKRHIAPPPTLYLRKEVQSGMISIPNDRRARRPSFDHVGASLPATHNLVAFAFAFDSFFFLFNG
jgi:hypothetical protein